MNKDRTDSSIIVVGSSNFDINLRVREIPMTGETILASNMETGFGGKGANQAFTISKIGGKVDYLTCIGDDVFGKLYLETFRANNFNMDLVNVIESQPNGIALVNIDDEGRNTIVVYPGSSRRLTPDIIKANFQKVFAHRIIMTQLEIPVETAEFLVSNKSADNIIALNPSPVNMDYDYSNIMRGVDILIPNEVELSQLTGKSTEKIEDVRKATETLIAAGVKNMVVTLGKKGVFIKNDRIDRYIEAPDVKVVDTAGAGDAFAGSFVYKYSLTGDLQGSAVFANKVATISVTRYGTHKSVPTREEIEQMKDFFSE